ncbi:hypothetical protein D0Z08_14905 [Nocardioides immobilis]|uniref:Zn-ribbon domain-containing OB-fold protein n=2 Tax=Nocardioides immobilis TaxID=2049295 RepID=A0A417Y181_9ACTN|nr:hypothetical protein D0Z08_14905 [Nocardioides immobilis]
MERFPIVEVTAEPELEPYWSAAREGRLVLARCSVCGATPWMPRPFCSTHPRAVVEWIETGGRATIYSWTTVMKGEGVFKDSSPYVLAVVELEDGPRILTNVVTGDDEHLCIGQPVSAVFDHRAAGGSILRFITDDARTGTPLAGAQHGN